MDDRNGKQGPVEPKEGAEVRLLRLAGPRPPVAPDRQARVRAAVHSHWQRQRETRRRRLWWWVVAPLAAAAVLVVALLAPRRGPALEAAEVARVDLYSGTAKVLAGTVEVPVRMGAALAAHTTVETGEGGRVALRFSGGASVRLDGGSRVILVAADRVLVEHGAVYVDSGPEPVRSGLVIAYVDVEIRDVGTQFEVRPLDEGLRVRVREGTVVWRDRRHDETVAAGMEAMRGADGAVTQRPVSPYGPEWGWVLSAAPPFRIEGRTVGEFLTWAAREAGLELRWVEPSLATSAAKVILHGDIGDVGPIEAPAMVLPTCGLVSRVEEGGLLVEAMNR